MASRSLARPSARPLLGAALATLALTAAHHVYGGVIYATPWRIHGAAVAVALGLVLYAIARVYARTGRAAVGYVLAALVLAMPVLATGLFEGVYNHLAKNALYFAGASHDVLVRLFPPPTYELPDDILFEVSGVAQILPAVFAALAAYRFVRALRGQAPACDRPSCNRRLALRCLTTITGEPIEVPDPALLVHLQFRRFAGCPVCNLHLRSFVRRHDAIEAAGIREVVVFHSSADELRVHAGDLPFAVIADPDRRLYAELGVTSSVRSLLDPRAWGPILVAVTRSVVALLRGRERSPSMNPHGGRFGLPADFLIGPDGRIVACKHGQHVYDQWSVDELLEHARSAARATRPAGPAAASRGGIRENAARHLRDIAPRA